MDVPWNRRKLNCIYVDNTHTALRHRLLIKIIHSYKADTSLDTQEWHCHIASRSLPFQLECCSRGINTWNSSDTQEWLSPEIKAQRTLDIQEWSSCNRIQKVTFVSQTVTFSWLKGMLCSWHELYLLLKQSVTSLSCSSKFILWQKVFSRYTSLAFSWHTHIRDVLVDGDVVR